MEMEASWRREEEKKKRRRGGADRCVFIPEVLVQMMAGVGVRLLPLRRTDEERK